MVLQSAVQGFSFVHSLLFFAFHAEVKSMLYQKGDFRMAATRNSHSMKNYRSSKKYFLALAAAATGSLLNSLSADATTYYWRTSATTVGWALGTNWSTTGAGGTGTVAPGAGDIADFDSATYAFQLTAPNAQAIGGIISGDGATSTGAMTIT